MNGDLVTNTDPFAVFAEWLKAAEAAEPNDPNAMSLATVDADGMPNVRTVLLKGYDANGFVFYTNYESAKGRELLASPKAAANPPIPPPTTTNICRYPNNQYTD